VEKLIAADCWHILNLDEREARQLATEIRRLVEHVKTRPTHRSQKKYLLRYALLRRTGDDLFVP
jgi:hypothetical protein